MPTTEYARMRRSDHSMRPPSPAATIAYKSPIACNSCHTDRGPAWADRKVRQWYERDYQAPVLALAGLVDAPRRQDWSQLPGILAYIQRGDHDEIFTVSLIRLLAACRDPSRLRVLGKSMDDSSPLVRAATVMALSQEMTQEAVLPLL